MLVQAASAPGMEGALRMENAAAAGFQWVQEHPHAFHMFIRDVTDPEISEAQEALRRASVTAMADVMEMEPPETRAGHGPAPDRADRGDDRRRLVRAWPNGGCAIRTCPARS